MTGINFFRKLFTNRTGMGILGAVVASWTLGLIAFRLAAPAPVDLALPGTALTVRLLRPINSHSARVGEPFQAVVVSTTTPKGSATIPTGTVVEGRCVAARPEEDGGKPGYLRLTLSGLWDNQGRYYRLETTALSESGDESLEEGHGELGASPGAGKGSAQVEWPPEAVVSPEADLTFVLLKPLAFSPYRRAS